MLVHANVLLRTPCSGAVMSLKSNVKVYTQQLSVFISNYVCVCDLLCCMCVCVGGRREGVTRY